MKWSFVDSCGLDIVLKTQANGRVFHAHEKLQQGSYGLTKASIRQPCHRTFGAYRQFDPLTILLFRTSEHICSWNCPADHGRRPQHAVFGYPPDKIQRSCF